MSYVPHELFESAVPYYARYRSGYPADRLDALAAALGLDRRARSTSRRSSQVRARAGMRSRCASSRAAPM